MISTFPVPQSIEDILDACSPADRAIVIALRDVVLHTLPGIEETLLWGALSYHRPERGGRIKGAVCLITITKGGVHLEFIHGVRMADPRHVLRGTLKSKRVVKINGVASANRREIVALIRAADAVRFE